METRFHTLDVFTDRIFGGNPLAVFPDADGIAPETMQKIAKELNLSETVFITADAPPGRACRLRIFTPASELPFAGHPTVGTAFLLAAIGRVPLEDGSEVKIVFEEGVGAVPVTIRVEDGRPVFARLTAARVPEHGPPPPPNDAIAEVLSLDAADLGGSIPISQVSAGVPFLFVSVRNLDALGRIRLSLPAWERHVADGWAPHVYVVTDDAGEGVALRARMFAPAMGIAEDPATGAAASALAGLLAQRDGNTDGTYRWTVEQGVEMGRPSRLHLEADVAGGAVTAVRVGGASVLVSTGTFTLPD